jgi:hypothetical protein
MPIRKLCVVIALGLVLMFGDPAKAQTGTFTAAGNTIAARQFHTATLLSNGLVLVAGGRNGSILATAELYNPATGSFIQTGSMHFARELHSATLMKNGKVLVAGGWNGSSYLSSAELYDPTTGQFTVTSGSLNIAREYQTATQLLDGRVLLAGGNGNSSQLSSTELFDPSTGTFTIAATMHAKRNLLAASLMLNGKVLITGGWNGSSYNSSAEIFDPSNDTFTLTGNMSTPREFHTSTLLGDGTVLIAGGRSSGSQLSSAEIYNPAAGIFALTTGSMHARRNLLSASLLASGQVLVAGGYDGSNFLASAELYDPAAKTFTLTGSMATAREFQLSTLLANGNILVTGGQNSGNGTISSAELYHAPAPVTGSISPKYLVLSVMYAPPGQQSFVDYGSSTALGTTTSLDNSKMTSSTLAVQSMFNSGGFTKSPMPVGLSIQSSYGVSQTWTDEMDTSSSFATQKSTQFDIKALGPLDSQAGINHDYDQIIVQLNPEIDFTITSPFSASYVDAFDPRDPTKEVDAIYLTVKDLKALQAGTYNADPTVLQRLKRAWAPNLADGSAPGLTSTDYTAILAQDPLANGTTIDSVRFDEQFGVTFPYQPPPQGGQPLTVSGGVTLQTTSTLGMSATTTYATGTSVSAGVTFGNWFNTNFTKTTSTTWKTVAAQQYTVGSGQTSTVSITGPNYGYTGPTNLVIYKDNIYGTFMFFLIN